MAYPADAFNGGVDGAWYDAQSASNFKFNTVALSNYGSEPDGNRADEVIDKSPNGNNLYSPDETRDLFIHNEGGLKYWWDWGRLQGDSGGASTGFYLCIVHKVDDVNFWSTTLWSDSTAATNGFKLEFDGAGFGLPSNSGYKFSAGNGSTRVNAIISSGDPLYTHEGGKKVIECWWSAALGLNIRINKGTPVTVACGSVSAGSATFTISSQDSWMGRIYAYLHTKNSVPDGTGRDAIVTSLAALGAVTLSGAIAPITGVMHARELPIDDDVTALGTNFRTGTANIFESGGRDSVSIRQGLYVGGRSGTANISETGSDSVSIVRQPPDVADAAFLDWLKSSNKIVTLLVEVEVYITSLSGEYTRYLSNNGYTTGPADTPSSANYYGVITSGGVITEQLSFDGSAAMAFGDIEIDNANGSLDSYLEDVWVGRPCRVYIGDKTWNRNQFKLIFDGITANLESRDRSVLNLVVRDKLERLNTSVTEDKLGGNSSNSDRVMPLTFGEAFNVSPLQTDAALLKYAVHHSTGAWNSCERVIEVRNNGVPVAHTPDLGTGSFTLSASPGGGTITASVQGDSSPYNRTPAKIIQRIVKAGGTNPFSDSDIDLLNFAQFDANHQQTVGAYLADSTNVLEVCQALAASVGAQLVPTAIGLLRLRKIELPIPSGITPTLIDHTKMMPLSLRISNRPNVQAAVKIGYCRNWTVQPNLQTSIPPEHKDLYAREWMTTTARDSAVAAKYKRTQEPEQVNTLLVSKTEAEAEAMRRLNLWKVQRSVVQYEGSADLLSEQLGGYQTIYHGRYGMSGGKTGQIVSIRRDWLQGKVSVEVLI